MHFKQYSWAIFTWTPFRIFVYLTWIPEGHKIYYFLLNNISFKKDFVVLLFYLAGNYKTIKTLTEVIGAETFN